MTTLMEQAMERLRSLPVERQDEFAARVMMMADEDIEPFTLTDEDRIAIAESRAQAARGEFVSDEDMQAFWAKCGLRKSDLPQEQSGTWPRFTTISSCTRRQARPA